MTTLNDFKKERVKTELDVVLEKFKKIQNEHPNLSVAGTIAIRLDDTEIASASYLRGNLPDGFFFLGIRENLINYISVSLDKNARAIAEKARAGELDSRDIKKFSEEISRSYDDALKKLTENVVREAITRAINGSMEDILKWLKEYEN